MSDEKPLPKRSAEMLQIDITKVAFEVAKVSSLLGDYMRPRNSLLGTSSEKTAEALKESYERMMALCGELLGMEKGDE